MCIICSNWFEMVEVRYLTPKFLRHHSQFLERDAASPPPPFHLRNVNKDMAATWCKGKVHAGNLLYIVMASVSI